MSKHRIGVAVLVALVAWLALLGAAGECRADSSSGRETIRLDASAVLGSAQGLPHDVVYSIAQDGAGFVWLGTQDGLVRFDGHGFTTYRSDPFDPASLAEDNISELVIVGDDLWIATWGGGVDRFDLRTETFVHHPVLPDSADSTSVSAERLPDGRIQTILVTSDGQLWAGTYAGGLALLDRQTGRFEIFDHDPADPTSLPSNRVWDLEEAEGGGLWAATDEGLVRLGEQGRVVNHFRHDPDDPRALPGSQCRSLEVDASGTVWVGTDGGLARGSEGEHGFRIYRAGPGPDSLPSDIVNTILDDGLGGVWVGTSGGLVRLDLETGRIERAVFGGGDGSDILDIRHLVLDRAQTLWITTRGRGITKLSLRPRIFEAVTPGPPGSGALGSGTVTSLAEDGEGRFWVGTVNGLYRRDGDRFTLMPVDPDDPRALPSASAQGLAVDTQGRLWVHTWRGGLSRYLGEDEGFVTHQPDLDDPLRPAFETIRTLVRERQGRFWIGFEGGFALFDPLSEEVVRAFFGSSDQGPILADPYVRVILEDRRGRLWVGTDRGGLHLFDAAGRLMEHYQHDPSRPDSLVGNRVVDIFEDHQGRIWVGTADGLGLWAPEGGPGGRFENFRTREGLPGVSIQAIAESEDHYLWIATNSGISRLDPSLRAFRNFTTADGLHGSTFFAGSVLTDSRGRLYFGGYGGFSRVDPEGVPEVPETLPLVLTGFTVFGERRDLGIAPDRIEEVVLEPEEDVIGFELAALDYLHPESHRYRHQMVGFDRGWVYAGERRLATYTNLDSGSYTFRAQVAGLDGTWQEPGLAIRVVIRTPLWQRPWFLALAVAALVALLTALYQARIRQMRRRERELALRVEESVAELRSSEERLMRAQKLESLGVLAGGIAHDFNSLLTGVLGQIDLLRMEIPDDERDLGGYLDEAERAAVRATQLSSQMLAYSGRGAFQLEHLDVVEAVREAVEEVRGELSSHIRIDVEPPGSELLRIHADAGQIRQVITNVLANAAEAYGEDGGWIQVVFHLVHLGRAELNGMLLGDQARAGSFLGISVQDLGEGMTASQRERIFDPFYTTRGAGRGLGLPVVLGIVRGHGGAIDIHSTPGEGTEIRIYLPRAT